MLKCQRGHVTQRWKNPAGVRFVKDEFAEECQKSKIGRVSQLRVAWFFDREEVCHYVSIINIDEKNIYMYIYI